MNSKQLKEVSLRIGVVTAFFILTCVLDAHARTLKKVESVYNQKIAVDQKALALIAEEVSQFLSHVHKSIYVQVSEGKIFKGIVTIDDVKDTINFLAKHAKEHPNWLKSHWFYNTYFDFYRLYSDGEFCPLKIGKLPRGWIGAPDNHRITKYRICKMHGSRTKTKKYFFPLYSRPSDEVGKTNERIRNNPEKFIRFMYKRSEILEGALEHKKEVQPLAWVTLEGYKELVMQGSAVIDFEDQTTPQTFQVVVENDMAREDKYWFVAPYEKRKPSKKYPIKVEPIPGVSFAGNISDIGFGKVLVMIGKNPLTLEKEMRVGVLTDTGTAFQDNLCKFDLFTGYFEEHQLFDEHCKQYPHTAEMYILIKKRKK